MDPNSVTSISTGWDAILTGAGYGTSALGTFMQGSAYYEHGLAQQALARYAATQFRQNAADAEAAAQRNAVDIGRRAEYIASAQLARAAASGGGASDPTVMNIIARTKGEAAYQQAVALYGGQSRARALNMQAAGEDFTGRDEARAGRNALFAADIGASTTLMKGGVSLLMKYGRGGPDAYEGPGIGEGAFSD